MCIWTKIANNLDYWGLSSSKCTILNENKQLIGGWKPH